MAIIKQGSIFFDTLIPNQRVITAIAQSNQTPSNGFFQWLDNVLIGTQINRNLRQDFCENMSAILNATSSTQAGTTKYQPQDDSPTKVELGGLKGPEALTDACNPLSDSDSEKDYEKIRTCCELFDTLQQIAEATGIEGDPLEKLLLNSYKSLGIKDCLPTPVSKALVNQLHRTVASPCSTTEDVDALISQYPRIAERPDGNVGPPLITALRRKRPDLAIHLIRKHNVNVNLKPTYVYGRSAIEIAKEDYPGNSELINLLVERGAT